MIGGKRNAVAVVAAIGGHIDALHRAGDEDGRHAVVLGQLHVLDGRADGRRHDHAVAAELQKRLDEAALLLHRIVVVGQDEGMLAAVQLAFDRLEDFAVERVHDVVHDDADDARARGAQAGGAAIVDIAEGAGLFLDPVAGGGRHQRAVA